MVFLKSRTEIDKLKEAGKIVAEVLDKLEKEVRPGISTTGTGYNRREGD